MKLAAESQRRHLEATLANAKRDAAQATSAHKLAAATWQAECSTHEKEVSVGGADSILAVHCRGCSTNCSR